MSTTDSFQIEDLPLLILFHRAHESFQKLQYALPGPEESNKLVQDAIACLQRAAVLVDNLALFSSNEDAEDLATGDLQYLMIPYYHAELLSTLYYDQPDARIVALKAACRLHNAFLTRLQQYGLLREAAARNIAPSLLESNETLVMDPTSLRERKIERFKLERSIHARLEALRISDEQTRAQEDDGGEREAQLLRLELSAYKVLFLPLISII